MSSKSVLDVNFPTTSVGHRDPWSLEILNEVGNHSLAILDFSTYELKARNIPENTPVEVTWGSIGAYQSLQGYVNHHEVLTDTRGQSILRAYIIGASRVLNDVNPTSWRKVTGSYIATQVARRHGLKAVVNKSPILLAYWHQGAESDFAMLTRLAKRIGFHFWVDGVTLHFRDPNVVASNAQRFTFTRDGADSGNMVKVHLASGSMVPGHVPQSLSFGLSRQGRVIQATSKKHSNETGLTAGINRAINKFAAQTTKEALDNVNADLARGGWSNAEVEVEEGTQVKIGDVINLDGASVHIDYRGEWLATKVQHLIDTYQDAFNCRTILKITRNQADRNQFKTTTQTSGSKKLSVNAVLRSNSQWEADALAAAYV